MKFSTLKTYLAANGFLTDLILIDRRIIENRRCPKCRRFYVYQGFSNSETALAFGVCRSCNYAERFFGSPAMIASGRKRYSAQA